MNSGIPVDFLIKVAIALILFALLSMFFLSGSYKKIFNKKNASGFGKITSKVVKDGAKSAETNYNKLKSAKIQLPGGIRQTNNSTPIVSTPATVPKTVNTQTVVMYADPIITDNSYIGMAEIVMVGTDGWWPHHTLEDGNSIEFNVVGMWDEKNDRFKLWIYDPRPHEDKRKARKSYA